MSILVMLGLALETFPFGSQCTVHQVTYIKFCSQFIVPLQYSFAHISLCPCRLLGLFFDTLYQAIFYILFSLLQSILFMDNIFSYLSYRNNQVQLLQRREFCLPTSLCFVLNCRQLECLVLWRNPFIAVQPLVLHPCVIPLRLTILCQLSSTVNLTDRRNESQQSYTKLSQFARFSKPSAEVKGYFSLPPNHLNRSNERRGVGFDSSHKVYISKDFRQ